MNEWMRERTERESERERWWSPPSRPPSGRTPSRGVCVWRPCGSVRAAPRPRRGHPTSPLDTRGAVCVCVCVCVWIYSDDMDTEWWYGYRVVIWIQSDDVMMLIYSDSDAVWCSGVVCGYVMWIIEIKWYIVRVQLLHRFCLLYHFSSEEYWSICSLCEWVWAWNTKYDMKYLNTKIWIWTHE